MITLVNHNLKHMVKNMTNLLVIYYNKSPSGYQYRCSGGGEAYTKFYRWVDATSYRCTHDDFPWDYFVFDNPADHQKLLDEFSPYVIDDDA